MGHAFFDESGKLADSDFVCIAGYIAGDEDWNKFCEKWGSLLGRHKIPYIHMREMIALSGPYQAKGWTHKERDEVLTEFIDVIREHIWGGFGVAVNAKYLRSMGKDAMKRIGDPQIFCFQRIISRVLLRLEEVGYQPVISAIFDDSEAYSVRCYRTWSKLRRMVPAMHKRIPSITFADDKHFFPLQAADILAWETNKSLRQQVGNLPVRGTLTRLLSDTEPGFNLDYTGEAWN
jgi:hypothetical protein